MKISLKKYRSLFYAVITVFLLVLLVACNPKVSESNDFELIRDSIVIPKTVTNSVTLPTETDLVEGAKLSWTTNNHNVLTKEGLFIRPDEDTNVNLKLFVTIGIETKVFDYFVVAKGWEDQKVDVETFKNPAGFASLGVTDRKGQTENYYIVNNELEFLNAFIDSENQNNVIIEITNDLNLGARHIGKLIKEANLWEGEDPKAGYLPDEGGITRKYLDGNNYRENTNLPEIHPRLIENGVGQLMIDGRDGLLIFSKTGISINHLTVQLKGEANNIVFRNLVMEGIWEWDEIDRGDYKALDWDFFTIEFAHNIWLDHLTFRTAYDGIVDVKGGVSNITLSWINMDFVVTDYIREQFDHLEANINNFPFYRELRQTVSREDIEVVAAGQKKGFNFGNTEGGPNFESITATLHHVYAKNLQDRFPRLRRGDVHLYNVVLDSEDLRALRHVNMKVISQGMVPTEQGAILMENSRFIGVNEPIKTHQSSNLDSDYTGKFKVIDSEYFFQDFYYAGSSSDSDFFNPWQRSNQNINYDLDFFFRNYETIPYEYQLDDADKLTKIFKDNLIGAGEIAGFDWLEITGQVDADTVDKGYKIDESKILGLDTHIAQVDTEIETFVPELYNFYTGTKLVADRHYQYYVDTSNVDMTKAGIYQVEYTFVLLHNESRVTYQQEYVVYDPELPNEVYATNIPKPFDHILSGEVFVFEPEGDLYYYLSNNAIESSNLVISEGVKQTINTTTVGFSNLDVEDSEYIHFVVVNDEGTSGVYTYEIAKETVVEINTIRDFNQMLIDANSKGKYYKLTTDLDFTDFELYYLNADNIFSGVFDGQGFTISNIDRHAYGGGIFHTITDGKVKNVTFDNVKIEINRTAVVDEETGEFVTWQNTSARSGIVAGQIKGGAGILENIKIVDSLVKTNNNYGAIVIGKVEGYSQAEFRGISVINSEVDQDGEYAGGITAGVANNSTAIFEDIFIKDLKVSERNSKMIGVIAGRSETGVTVNRVVAINVELYTTAAVGGVFGKDDRKGQTLTTSISNVFIDIKNMTSEIQYLGALIGNPDASFGHVVPLENTWQTPFTRGSSGVNAQNEITLDLVTNEWWSENFEALLATDLWEIKDNLIVLK